MLHCNIKEKQYYCEFLKSVKIIYNYVIFKQYLFLKNDLTRKESPFIFFTENGPTQSWSFSYRTKLS